MCNTPTVTINISATTETPYPPILFDGTNRVSSEDGDTNLVTAVVSGSNIVFTIGGDVTAITAVTYTGENNVFKTPPSSQRDGSWTGVIGSFTPGTEETYSISYTVKGDSRTYTQDPKIRINK